MGDDIIGSTDEEILGHEVSDAALETAAASPKDRAVSFTVSYCSGLDTCPA